MPSKTTSRLSIKQALNNAYQTLKSTSTSAWLDAEILLSFVLNKDRSYILAHSENLLTISQEKILEKSINRRLNHEPIAYITGHKEFYGLDFKVTKNVLVPRPESELMIDEALKIINPQKNTLVIDIGTGSGCLIITLLHELKKKKIQFKGIALDISSKALTVAKQNAKQLKVTKVDFLKSDLLSAILKKPSLIKKATQIIILANLPYVTPQEIKKEKSISKEPKLALDGGKDGLVLYRELKKQLTSSKELSRASLTMLCEINPHQSSTFRKIWQERVIFKKDMSGKIRVGIIKNN